MKRRNFLSRLFGVAAVVALAPRLCFRAEPLQWTGVGIYEQLKACKSVIEEPLDLTALFQTVYAIKKERENNGKADTIDFYIPDTPEGRATIAHLRSLSDP